jgi:hypothetical protein
MWWKGKSECAIGLGRVVVSKIYPSGNKKSGIKNDRQFAIQNVAGHRADWEKKRVCVVVVVMVVVVVVVKIARLPTSSSDQNTRGEKGQRAQKERDSTKKKSRTAKVRGEREKGKGSS